MGTMYSYEAEILVLGLDYAGKSSIIKNIQNLPTDSVFPTAGWCRETTVYRGCIRLSFYEWSGESSLRSSWRYEGEKALIYVIDISHNEFNDINRIEESCNALDKFLERSKISNIPVLIYANKVDYGSHAIKVAELKQKLQPILSKAKIPKWEVYLSSSNGTGIHRGMEFLIFTLWAPYEEPEPEICNSSVKYQKPPAKEQKVKKNKKYRNVYKKEKSIGD